MQFAAIMGGQRAEGFGSELGSGSKGGLSIVEAGVISAMTMLGVVLLVALLSWWAGVGDYGRNLDAKVHSALIRGY